MPDQEPISFFLPLLDVHNTQRVLFDVAQRCRDRRRRAKNARKPKPDPDQTQLFPKFPLPE